LGESERLQSGHFVAVAVAFDALEATLVRDYLREHRIDAQMVPATPPFSLTHFLREYYLWVPARQVEQAIALLRQLHTKSQKELPE
jgi:hypothetical protein